MTVVRLRCEECTVKIPKRQPILVCDLCNKIKHLKCERLTKSDANYIKHLKIKWTCHQCLSEILPINATKNKNTEKSLKVKIKCTSCNGFSYSQKNVRICGWCSGKVHAKCWNGELGCNSCCEEMYPGFKVYTYELCGIENFKNTCIHNPYSSAHFAMQIGGVLDNETENDSTWSDVSNFLISCKYKEIKHINASTETELDILSLNVRHLHNKINTLREDIETYQKFDILCFNECNLKLDKLPHGIDDLILDGFYEPVIQEPIRKSGKGGGLAIYVNKRVCDDEDCIKTFNPNPEPENTSGEFQFIKITKCKGSGKTVVLGNVYRSPSRKPEAFNTLYELVLQNLHRHSKKKNVYIVGDFNQDVAKYEIDANIQNLVDTAACHGLVQLVSRPTRITEHSATIVDLVFTNNIDNTLSCNIITLDLSDHLAIHTKVALNSGGTYMTRATKHDKAKNREFRIFNEMNDNIFRNYIDEETWDDINDDADAQSQYDKFTEIYTKHYNSAYPLKTEHTRRKNERKKPRPWILPWLEDACSRKNMLYHTYVKEPTIANKTIYLKMKEFCEKHIKKAKSKYYDKFFKDYNDNSRKQWQMINSLLNRNKKRVDISKLVDKEGNVANTPSKIAENFNDYFANVASNLKSGNNDRTESTDGTDSTYNSYQSFLRQPVQNPITIRTVEPQEVHDVINNFKNKSTLDTKISALKVANSSYGFTSIVSKIINTSFSEGIFPHQLKNARVVPVFKQGNKFEVENYRPISLLSCLSKIYEKLMHNRISNFLELNNVLHDMQYGFRAGRSCEHALLTAKEILLNSLSKRQVSLLLLIDFSKAFDMVEHSVLLKKLEHYGIRGTTLKWMKSYLENRMQFVTIEGIDSSTREMKFGVPQGSILGPLLFIIYINDLPQISNFAKFIMYADDANIILTGDNITEISEKLSVLGNELEKWVESNGLALNLKKTKYMIFSRQRTEVRLTSPFSISNVEIEQKSEARFLGVIVDENLTWTTHIKTVQTKMSRYIGIMYKLKNILPLKSKIQIYHSFVQSHINYCSLVWGFSAKSNIEKLFRAQKKGMRAIVPGYINYRYREGITPGHTKQYFNKFKILTVQGLITMNALLFLHKVRNFPLILPISVKNTVAENSPVPGSTFESSQEWLASYNNHIYNSSVFFKGPLLAMIPEISNLITPACLFSIKAYKCSIKRHLLKIQSMGESDEWHIRNFILYTIPGLRNSTRLRNVVSYEE